MKEHIFKIFVKVKLAFTVVQRYRITLFIVFFLGIYTFLVAQIGTLVNSNPSQAAINEKLQTIKRLRIDQESIDRILLLEEQNIEVQALFKQARNNPFTE